MSKEKKAKLTHIRAMIAMMLILLTACGGENKKAASYSSYEESSSIHSESDNSQNERCNRIIELSNKLKKESEYSIPLFHNQYGQRYPYAAGTLTGGLNGAMEISNTAEVIKTGNDVYKNGRNIVSRCDIIIEEANNGLNDLKTYDPSSDLSVNVEGWKTSIVRIKNLRLKSKKLHWKSQIIHSLSRFWDQD